MLLGIYSSCSLACSSDGVLCRKSPLAYEGKDCSSLLLLFTKCNLGAYLYIFILIILVHIYPSLVCISVNLDLMVISQDQIMVLWNRNSNLSLVCS